MKEELVYLGVDIAKSHLDAAIGAQKHRFCNDTVGHRQLVRWIEQTGAAVQVIWGLSHPVYVEPYRKGKPFL